MQRGFGNVPHCHETDDGHEICKVTCISGYTFLPGNTPLPEYLCGKNTSYVWNGKPPSCGSMIMYNHNIIFIWATNGDNNKQNDIWITTCT